MYYLMNDDDEILDVYAKCPTQEQVNRAAQSFGCDVWVMKGEVTGISAKYVKDETSQSHKES